MNKLYLTLAIVFGIVFASTLYTTPFPSNYESLSAAEKLSFIWGKAKDDNGVPTGPLTTWIQGRLVLPESLGGYSFTPTGHLHSDQMPGDKSKGIHHRGFLATAAFEWNVETKSNYTGIFKGADHVLLRMSVPAPPSVVDGKFNASPGIGIKILRNGVESGNLVSMYSLLGQEEKSYFAHCFGNQIDFPPSDQMSAPEKILFDKFSRYDKMPTMIGLADFGAFTQEGEPEPEIKVPMYMYWQPNPEVQKLCANVEMDGDFFGCLSTLKAGTVLWKLHGVDAPYTETELKSNGKEVVKPLGYLKLTSDGAIKSKFGDEKIQFRHTFWSEELDRTNKRAAWDEKTKKADFKDVAGCPRYTQYLQSEF